MTYENPHESADGPPESAGLDYWTGQISGLSSHGDFVLIVLKNATPVAYITCDSEEEARWLKDRLTGTRRTN